LCSGVSETSVAFTVLPLSVLVPRTNAHVFVCTAVAFTVFVSESAVFEEKVTVVVAAFFVRKSVPLTVSVEPLSFVTEPNAKLKLPARWKPLGGRTVPVPPDGSVKRPARPSRPPTVKPLPHFPLTGAEIEMWVAMTTPFAFFVPFAMTHAPTFSAERDADACSVIRADPADTTDLPVGLSDVVIVNVDPFTATTGPNTDPCTGDAAIASAAKAVASIVNHHPSSCCR